MSRVDSKYTHIDSVNKDSIAGSSCKIMPKTDSDLPCSGKTLIKLTLGLHGVDYRTGYRTGQRKGKPSYNPETSMVKVVAYILKFSDWYSVRRLEVEG
jgi:hypothetical protein